MACTCVCTFKYTNTCMHICIYQVVTWSEKSLCLLQSSLVAVALVLLRETTILTRTAQTLLKNCACQPLKIVWHCARGCCIDSGGLEGVCTVKLVSIFTGQKLNRGYHKWIGGDFGQRTCSLDSVAVAQESRHKKAKLSNVCQTGWRNTWL